jgi:putative membrane protein
MSPQDNGEGLRPQVFVGDKPRGPETAERVTPRIIETAQTGRIVPAPVKRATVTKPEKRRGSLLRKMAWTGLFGAVAVWLGIDLYLWIEQAFAYSTGLGWAATATVATGVAAAGALTIRELRSYLDLKHVEDHQRVLGAPSEAMRASNVQAAIREVIAEVPKDRESLAAIEAFQRQVQRHHTPAQQIALLSQTVMAPLDRRAEAIIRRASTRAFGITAISPTAVTDAVFFIYTAVRMLREIATCYGHRPTAFATGHLLRRLIGEAGKLGAVDLAGAALSQHLGGAVLEKIAAGAAESTYAAQRMARLGLVTMGLCRPVPFKPDEIPGITSSLIGNLLAGRTDKPQDD